MKRFDFCPFCQKKMTLASFGSNSDCVPCRFWTNVEIFDGTITMIVKCEPFGIDKDKRFEKHELDEFERLLKLRSFQ